MTRQLVKLTESKIRQIVSETIKEIIRENRFANPYNKMHAAAYARARETGENADDLYNNFSEKFNSRTAALKDINKEITNRRNTEVNDFDDQDFYRAVGPDLFDQDDEGNGLFGDNMDNPDSGRFADDVYNDGDSDLYYKG